MAHYFENDDTLNKQEITRNVLIQNVHYSFVTDNGVFSKRGLDFGTRSLLENLPLHKIKGTVLDVGCGYGPIGIHIAKNTNAQVHMIDVNQRSLNLARKNAALNHVDVQIYESDAYENVREKFDYIVSNPPIRVGKEKLYQILFGAREYLKEDGELWIVVHKDQGAKTMMKNLKTEYKVELKAKNKGFYIISCCKFEI